MKKAEIRRTLEMNIDIQFIALLEQRRNRPELMYGYGAGLSDGVFMGTISSAELMGIISLEEKQFLFESMRYISELSEES